MEFAKTVVELAPLLMATKTGLPELPEALPPAIVTFHGMEWGRNPELWSYGSLQDVFTYLRGSQSLSIPEAWGPLIPRSLV